MFTFFPWSTIMGFVYLFHTPYFMYCTLNIIYMRTVLSVGAPFGCKSWCTDHTCWFLPWVILQSSAFSMLCLFFFLNLAKKPSSTRNQKPRHTVIQLKAMLSKEEKASPKENCVSDKSGEQGEWPADTWTQTHWLFYPHLLLHTVWRKTNKTMYHVLVAPWPASKPSHSVVNWNVTIWTPSDYDHKLKRCCLMNLNHYLYVVDRQQCRSWIYLTSLKVLIKVLSQ